MNTPAYFVFNVTAIHDPEGLKPYLEKVLNTITASNGTLLVAGGEVESVEGAKAQGRFFIVRFDSMAHAHAWYQSPGYQEIIGFRLASASCDAVLLEGLSR